MTDLEKRVEILEKEIELLRLRIKLNIPVDIPTRYLPGCFVCGGNHPVGLACPYVDKFRRNK